MTFRRTWLLLALLIGGTGAAGGPRLAAQAPPDTIPPDTIRPDTIPPDTVPPVKKPEASPLPDSARQQVPDSLRQVPDSVVAEDTVPPPRNLPRFPEPVPAGFGTGVWQWDQEALLGARALTLAELLDDVPGVVGLRAGDYGKPTSVTAFGLGGGRVRVFLDGVELAPLDGGVVDLSGIGLGGIGGVRVERRGDELRVELESLRNEDPRPYSLVEVGTGDLDTNLFRGTFSHPHALGGSLGLALDRVDTDGPRREEAGASTGGWLRYALHRGDQAGLAVDLRRMTADRDTFFDPREVTRTDVAVQGRWEPSDGLVVGGFWAKSSLTRAGEEEGDSLETAAIFDRSRTQLGLRVGLEKPWFWTEGAFTSHGGDGWPSRTARIEAGVRPGWLGGLQAGLAWEDWRDLDETATTVHLRGWTAPLLGLSIFGEYGDGRRGVPFPPLSADSATGGEQPGDTTASDPTVRITDRRFARYGLRFSRWGLTLGGARLEIDADSLSLLGLPMDVDGMWVEGGVRKGFEGFVDAPLFLGPLRFVGTYQEWDDDPDGHWRYFPDRTWEARLAFHDVYLQSGDLEVWFDFGVEGRDDMRVPFEPTGAPGDGTQDGGDGEAGGTDTEKPPPRLEEVQFYQSWYAWLEIRVVSVRIFLRWENLTNKDDNFDFPGTRLPGTRTMYGVRWTLWN